MAERKGGAAHKIGRAAGWVDQKNPLGWLAQKAVELGTPLSGGGPGAYDFANQLLNDE